MLNIALVVAVVVVLLALVVNGAVWMTRVYATDAGRKGGDDGSGAELPPGLGTTVLDPEDYDSLVLQTLGPLALLEACYNLLSAGEGYWAALLKRVPPPTPGSDGSADHNPYPTTLRFVSLLTALRRELVLVGVLWIICLIPMYSALSMTVGTHLTTYAWTPSAVFVSGKSAAAVLILAFLTMILLVLWVFNIHDEVAADVALDSAAGDADAAALHPSHLPDDAAALAAAEDQRALAQRALADRRKRHRRRRALKMRVATLPVLTLLRLLLRLLLVLLLNLCCTLLINLSYVSLLVSKVRVGACRHLRLPSSTTKLHSHLIL